MQEAIPSSNEIQLSKFRANKISSSSTQLDAIFNFLSEYDPHQDTDLKLNELTFSNSFSEDEISSEIAPEADHQYYTIKQEKKLKATQELGDLLDYLSANYDSKENRKPKKVLLPSNKGQENVGKNIQTVLPFVVKGVKNVPLDIGKEGKKISPGTDSCFIIKESL